MNKICKSFISLFIIFCLSVSMIYTVAFAGNPKNKILFFDDFSFELPQGTDDLFTGHGGSGSLKNRDTQRGMYVLTKDPQTTKNYVDPSFRTPAFTASEKKTVLDFSASYTGSVDYYTVRFFAGESELFKIIENETDTSLIHYQVVFDFVENTAVTYKNGVYSNEIQIPGDSELVGEEIQFRFIGYHIRKTNAELCFDHISIYETDNNPMSVLNQNNTGLDKVEVQFVAPLKRDITKDDVSVEGAVIQNVTRINGELNKYEIEFLNPLEFLTNYIFILNPGCITGSDDGASASFKTRDRVFHASTPTLTTDALSDGDAEISVKFVNETEDEKRFVLNATLYDGLSMVWTKFVPYSLSAGDSLEDLVTVNIPEDYGNMILKMAVFDSVTNLYPYTPVVSATSSGQEVTEVRVGSRSSESKLDYVYDAQTQKLDLHFSVSPEECPGFYAAYLHDAALNPEDIKPASSAEFKYFGYGVLNDAQTDVSYILPAISGKFSLSFITADDSCLNSIYIPIYTKEYIENALFNVNSASQPSEIYELLKFYEEPFGIDVADTYNEDVYLSFIANRTSIIENTEQLKELYLMCVELQQRNESNIPVLIEKVNNLISVASYSVYNTYLTDDALASVNSTLVSDTVLTYEDFADKLNLYTVIKGIKYAQNYKQVQNIIVAAADFSEIDISAYNRLETDAKKSVALNLLGDDFASFEEVKKSFDAEVLSHKKPSSSGSSSGSLSGSTSGSSVGSGNLKNAYTSATNYPADKSDVPVQTEFNDMHNHEWARDAVNHLVSVGAINGRGNGSFCPDDYLTRAEAAKIIAIAFGIKNDKAATQVFEDVPSDDWSKPYIDSLSSNGIMLGIDGVSFGRNNVLSRQMLATILYRTAKLCSIELSDKKTEFSDIDSADDYAREAISSLYGNGLINGTGNNLFSPLKECTRAEAAKMISEFLKYTN